MFLQRLAAGLVFLAGVVLSRLGVALESWPVLALGLIAATLGLWHFFMRGPASAALDPAALVPAADAVPPLPERQDGEPSRAPAAAREP